METDAIPLAGCTGEPGNIAIMQQQEITKAREKRASLFERILISIATLAVLSGMSGCASLPTTKTPREPSYVISHPNTSLSRTYDRQVSAQGGKSGFMLLGSGLDAFVARTELFKKAEKSIDVQYFIVWDDLAGKLFFRSLLDAAERGVRVRILLDDMPLKDLSPRLATLDQHPNIEIRSFNPLSRRMPRFVQYIFNFGKTTRRMHNKAVIVDNTLAIVGSRNIGNKYAAAKPNNTDIIFSGLDVLTVGPAVKMISGSFDEFWNNRHSIKMSNLNRPADVPMDEIIHCNNPHMAKRYQRFLKSSPLLGKIRDDRLAFEWGYARLAADPPEKITRKVEYGDYLNETPLEPNIAETDDELWIVSPYFIPNGEEGMSFFENLRRKGVRVTMVTNSYASTDNKIVNAHYAKYRKRLLAMGVQLFEFKANGNGAACCGKMRRLFSNSFRAGLHAKILSFDRRKTYVGAMNMDPRSIYENTELGLVISSPRLSNKITRWYDGNLDKFAYRLGLDQNDRLYWQDMELKTVQTVEPDTNYFERLFMRILGAVPVESLL